MTEPPPHPWYVRHWALIALFVLLAGQHVLYRWTASQEHEKRSRNSMRQLAFFPAPAPDHLENVAGTNEGKTFEATGQPSWIEWRDVPWGLQFAQLKLKTHSPCDWQSCYLQYVSEDDSYPEYDDVYLRERTVRPVVRANQDNVTLDWHLLRPAVRVRLLLPAGARFTIHELWFYAGHGTSEAWCFHLVLVCLNFSLLLFWLSQYVPILRRVLSRPAFVGCSIVGLHGVLMVWLLPPFQGPDENRHWKAAVAMFRGNADPILNDLPNLLGAEAPRWHGEVPYPAKTLRGSANRAVPPGEQSGVGYAGPWAYPVVGLVSLFFPSVQSLSDALIFYYCCRLVPLALLLFLVATLWRQRLASWTLVVFLSLPLVMQQCLIVSTDTVPNLGTLAAFLLFAQPRGRWTLFLLTFVCVLVVLAKPPIYALILVLPAWYLPWSRLWRWQIVLPLIFTAVGVVVAGYFVLWSVLQRTDASLATDAQRQLQSLLTPEGGQKFGTGLLEYPTRFLNPEYWWAPLGWLDTPLSDLHKNLLWASLLLGIAFDLLRGGRRTLARWREILEGVGLAVLHGVFTWVSLGAIMYLTITPLGAAHINGMQVRYMIPVVLFTLLLPAILMRRAEADAPQNPPRPWRVLGHGVLLALAVVRAIQLAGDLQYRYWG